MIASHSSQMLRIKNQMPLIEMAYYWHSSKSATNHEFSAEYW